MSEIKEILIAHYNSVRDEIMDRITVRRRSMTFFYTGSAAIFVIYVNNNDLYRILMVIPFFVLLMTARYIHEDINIRLLSLWIKTDYAKAMKEFLKENKIESSIPIWDTWKGEIGTKRAFASKLRYWTLIVSTTLVAVTPVAAYWLNEKNNSAKDESFLFFLITVSVLAILLCIGIIRYAWIHRMETAKEFGVEDKVT